MDREPDYRFTLANERTFLAWMRTALAFLAAAVLFHQFAVGLRPGWLPPALSAAVCLLAATVAGAALLQWRNNQNAMRQGQPLPPSHLLTTLGVAMLVLSAVMATILLAQ